MIQAKLKQCFYCPPNFLTVIWKTIYDDGEKIMMCKSHAMVKAAKKQVSINKERNDKLEKYYKAIHEKFKYTCQETGKILSYSNKHASHILPKSKYDYFEFDLRNGILLSWSIHSIVDRGSPEQRKELKVWQRIQDTRKRLLEEVGLNFDAKHWEIITY